MANRSFVVQYIIRARDRYVATANKVSRATERMTQRIKKAQMQMRGFRDAGLKMSAFVTAPLLLIARSFKNAARDAIETRSKFATVFKDISAAAQTAADQLAKNYGMTGTASRQLMGDTGDILTGFGFTQKAALGLSIKVNQLAVDLASFTNYAGGAEGASAALVKALLGEAESVKALGIVIRQDTPEYKALVRHMARTNKVGLIQAKALAALEIATKQSKNAIGDFARTQKDLANQERITSARIQDMKEAFGRALLPVALLITKALRSVVEWLTALSPRTKRVIIIIAALVAVIGPLLLLIAAIGVAIPAITAGFAALAPVAAIALGPAALLALKVVAALILLKYIGGKVFDFFVGFARGIRATVGPTFERLFSYFGKTAAIIGKLFGENGEATEGMKAFARVGQLVGEIVGTALDALLRTLMSVGMALGQLAAAVVSLDFSKFDVGAIKEVWSGFGQGPDIKIPTISNTVDVNVGVGLDRGLTQTTPAAVSTRGARRRRTDVGMVTAGS